jgi:hypothetical protein
MAMTIVETRPITGELITQSVRASRQLPVCLRTQVVAQHRRSSAGAASGICIGHLDRNNTSGTTGKIGDGQGHRTTGRARTGDCTSCAAYARSSAVIGRGAAC